MFTYRYADHIEFDAQISASYSPGKVMQWNNAHWLRPSRTRFSTGRERHQNVRLHRNRFHRRHRLPESAGMTSCWIMQSF